MISKYVSQDTSHDLLMRAKRISQFRKFLRAVCLLATFADARATFAQDIPEGSGSTETSDTETTTENSDDEQEEEKKRGNFLVLPIFIT